MTSDGEHEGGSVSSDRELARQLTAGWLAPADMFEVTRPVCVKKRDRVETTVTVTNSNDFPWAFGVEVVFLDSAGNETRRRTDQGFWQPGQSVELLLWAGKPERFGEQPPCEVLVYHGADLAFRDADKRQETYRRLGWDPVSETRIEAE